jgi:ubiquinone/menaquinone biosynthesis C-methylase UbiE
MEKLPKKFPIEVRKFPQDSYSDLGDENATENYLGSIDNAKLRYQELQSILIEYGIDLTKKVKVLEVGSGKAVFLDYMRQQGVDVLGIDVRPRGSKESPQVIARIEELPFKDESFDVILSSQVFSENFYNQDHHLMIKEIGRVLKSGGIYVAASEDISAKPAKEFKLVYTSSDFKFSVFKKS